MVKRDWTTPLKFINYPTLMNAPHENPSSNIQISHPIFGMSLCSELKSLSTIGCPL